MGKKIKKIQKKNRGIQIKRGIKILTNIPTFKVINLKIQTLSLL